MKLPHFIILHLILVGLLVAAWFLGYLPVFWAADKMFAIPVIGSLILVGLGMVGWSIYLSTVYQYTVRAQEQARSAIEGATWLADRLPLVGLALTVIGLLWTANAVGGDFSEPAAKKAAIDCLTGNLMGILGLAWLELNARVCR